jgi:D-sedoheptulose 7-phosphate isomerase
VSDLGASVDEHVALASALRERLLPQVERVAARIRDALAAGGTLLVFGNGGSAADAQHFAAELLGRFGTERRPLPAVALTTDSSTLTAIGNDYAFDQIFERQAAALAGPGDVAVGITTSGRSPNVVRGLAAAAERGATTVALVGRSADASGLAQHVVAVPSDTTARVQEMHGLIIHLICQQIDDWATGGDAG